MESGEFTVKYFSKAISKMLDKYISQ